MFYSIVDDDVPRDLTFRKACELVLLDGLVETVRKSRVTCLVAESVMVHWLQSLCSSGITRHKAHVELCPWPLADIPYYGLNGRSPLRQNWIDPTWDTKALTPEARAWRDAEVMQRQRENQDDVRYFINKNYNLVLTLSMVGRP